MPDTLLLTRADVARLLNPAELRQALRDGFVATQSSSGGRIPVGLGPGAPVAASAMLLAPGLIPGIPAYTVKVHAKFPSADPAIRGVVLLHALDDGRLLAIIESTHLTAARTGQAAALGADVLARSDAATAAIIGCGAQGRLQLECLAQVRRLTRVWAHDADPGRADAFARSEGMRLGLEVVAASTVDEAVSSADIVVTATWAREPFLHSGMLKPGTHLTTLGPDQPGKAEASSDLLRESIVIADNRALAVSMGAVGGVGLGPEAVHAELGEVLAGRAQGRRSLNDITIFVMVGLPFQDLAAAWLIHQRALAKGLGQSLDLLD